MYERILIAYDGSKESERALEEGVALAKALGSHVTLATVAEPAPGYVGLAAMVAPEEPEGFRQYQLANLGALQVKAAEIAKAKGLVIETTLIEASEVAGIIEAATSLKATLLVVGLRPHIHHVEWVGTVRQIANQSKCSILAVI